jgi:arylformamidase
MTWIDVSVPLRSGMVHWPGDPPVSIELVAEMARGDNADVTAIDMGAHTGTHMDAPSHFVAGAASLDDLDPDVVFGPARVIAISDPVAVTEAELERHDIQRGERLLFRTSNSERCWSTDDFVEDFVYVSEDAAALLAAQEVRLVGIDYLSVGGFHVDGAAIHRRLLGAGVWIIEGLELRDVAPGRYELICLPLRLAGAEGGPARVMLRAKG